ncbi:isochorismatase family protein [Undibacterium sp. RTI2.1]|uniref:isochorismatase family protein n=1 Tax=unclassified Undibacterium TaxID=2630295 RepID=UPI002AB59F6A|nr:MULTISPECIES: isochorismatase family protein [unclassified Undibacterium]MDY7540107.1 isochorismatase family protein [Undibacterium sp. 5I1]MEB0031702.1 isochorismatase family protein [Undibacterium sp. RTI2.1]MEB0118046.1 isochorismatase family protein [Undibacterium sp. RTI2.2]MEB0231782.1 isochorismatase family protein [Undibacterium sp. 10I3]MEB0259209.1 isochorismatase family protein [Undibacterium sp. 5I1]
MTTPISIPTTPKRALIVIDVQNEYFTGNMRIEYPDPQVSLHHIALAMDAAKAAGIPILVVQHSAPENSPIFARDSANWELHATVKSRPYDHLIEKSMASIFVGTDAKQWLEKNHIDTLTIVGYMTHNCNASTIYQAAHDAYQVEILSDATGALPYENSAGYASAEEIHRTFNVVFQSNFGAVASTAEWIKLINTGGVLEKSNVLVSHLAGRAHPSA